MERGTKAKKNKQKNKKLKNKTKKQEIKKQNKVEWRCAPTTNEKNLLSPGARANDNVPPVALRLQGQPTISACFALIDYLSN